MKKMSKGKKIAVSVAGALVLAAVGVYFGVSYYYSSHFFPRTVINGLNCAGLSVDQVKEKIQSQILSYTLTLTERGGQTEQLTGDQLELKYVDDKKVEALMEEQNPFAWPIYVVRQNEHEMAANISYSAETLTQLVDALACFQEENVTAPEDAKITDNGTTFEITPEVAGNTLKREETEQAIKEAIDTGKTDLNLEEEGLYVEPAVLSTDETLNNQMNQMNSLTSANITYDFVDRQFVVNRDVIKEWLVQDSEGNYTIDETKAASWVRQMAYETDTFGLAHTFKTSLGPTIELKGGGDYGWVINKDKTTAALVEAVKAGTQGTMEPVYLYSANDRSSNDIGDTYVEICISQQKMWCYKDGQLVVETPVVTGSHATGYDTPAGSVWAIDAKKTDYDFTLYTAHVMFWLPFNDQVGIHDSSWRIDYGGDIYLTSGSHGCVNTPYDAAEKIYNSVGIGDPVIVYYSLDDVVGPQPTQKNTTDTSAAS